MFRMFLLMLLSITSIIASAETEPTPKAPGFITDSLYIYLHSGPSTKYRIIGSVYAGDNVTKISESENGEFIQIEDKKQRVGWITAKYFSAEPSIKAQLQTLQETLRTQQEELTALQQKNQQLLTKLAAAEQQVSSQNTSLLDENQQLKQDITLLIDERAKGINAVHAEQRNVQNERMIYGACILFAGLIIGRIFSSFKRRSSFLE